MITNKWILYSVFATIFIVINDTIIKYITLNNINTVNFMSIVGCLLGLVALFVVAVRIKSYNISYQKIVLDPYICLLTIMFAIAFIFIMYGIISGIKYSPNPGYVKTIVATNAMILAIVSYYIFGAHISKISILGILVVILGLMILFSDCPM